MKYIDRIKFRFFCWFDPIYRFVFKRSFFIAKNQTVTEIDKIRIKKIIKKFAGRYGIKKEDVE